jgi:hypothetical protein
MASLAWALAMQAHAIDLGDGKLSINGFGEWFGGVTPGGTNAYLDAKPEGNYGDARFALALTSHPVDRATVAAQVHFRPGDIGVEVDWAFGEWRFDDHFRLQVGRFKHPLGIFGEVMEVGTVHPFLFLPQGVYGNTELTTEGVSGVGAHGIAFDRGGWTLSYDAYFGALEQRVDEPYAKLLSPQDLQAGSTVEVGVEESRETLGGRLELATPVEGLSVLASAYGSAHGFLANESGVRWVAGPSLEYTGDKLALRVEYFHHRDFDVARTNTAYALGSYFLTEHLQVALRGEISDTELVGFQGESSLLHHRELAAAINWWFTPGLVVKLSGHAIRGNRFAHPDLLDDALLAGTLAPDTFAAFGGMQFSF